MLKSSTVVICFMPITSAGGDLASVSFFYIFAKTKLFTLARLPGAGGWPRPEVVIAPALIVICIKTYRSLAKMGLVLEKGAHFQKGSVFFVFENRCPPLGAHAAVFRATTKNATHSRD